MDSDPSATRNIGILAHIDAGKTSLTERLLFLAGSIRSAGGVDEGTTTTDYLPVERERGITVKAAATHFGWKSSRINLIDTPGHVDFGSEVERSLRVLDGAVVLLCAVAGVQSRTEALYRACVDRGAPRIVFVNKMDRRGASFAKAVEDLRRILDPGAMPVQLPLGEGEQFRGLIDLVEMKALEFAATDAVPGAVLPHVLEGRIWRAIPADLAGMAVAARERLVEALADGSGGVGGDSSLMEDFVAGRESSPAALRAAIRSATLARRLTPILCGSAFVDGSAALLLDAVDSWLPSPLEALPPAGLDGAGGLVAQVFKTANDARLGRLSWLRLWTGGLRSGDLVLDAQAGRQARAKRLFFIQADRLETIESAVRGDIVAVSLEPLPESRAAKAARLPSERGETAAPIALGSTGATICDPAHPFLLEAIHFGEPVISLAIEPRARADAESIRGAVAAIVEDDPSLRSAVDPQTGRIELSGMGELHLEIAAERLAREYGAKIRVGKPRVAYREALLAPAEGREDFDRDLGGEQVRASVTLALGPGERGRGLTFVAEPSVRASQGLLAAVRRGVEAAVSVGPSCGFPLDDVAVTLLGLAAPGRAGQSQERVGERAVEIAASLAAGKAALQAGSQVLEPVMRLEIELPEDFLGEAAAAVAGRGGRIESVEGDGGLRLISGAAPLRLLFGFASELRSVSQGRAMVAARFLRYEPVPRGFVARD